MEEQQRQRQQRPAPRERAGLVLSAQRVQPPASRLWCPVVQQVALLPESRKHHHNASAIPPQCASSSLHGCDAFGPQSRCTLKPDLTLTPQPTCHGGQTWMVARSDSHTRRSSCVDDHQINKRLDSSMTKPLGGASVQSSIPRGHLMEEWCLTARATWHPAQRAAVTLPGVQAPAHARGPVCAQPSPRSSLLWDT